MLTFIGLFNEFQTHDTTDLYRMLRGSETMRIRRRYPQKDTRALN